MDLTSSTPAEIDIALRQLIDERAAASAAADRFQSLVNRLAGDTRDRTGHWCMTAADARAAVQTIVDTQRGSYAAERAQEALTSLRSQTEIVASLQHEIVTVSSEFNRRGGWTRAYLAVTNGRGHIHSSERCSTCNNGESLTRFYWFAELSGADQDEIIRQAGSDACTVCYPDAPVHDLLRPSTLFTPDEIQARNEREQRQAALAAKKAAAAAKAITNPDGTALRDDQGQVVKTERAAEIAAVDALVDDEFYEFTHHYAPGWRAYFERAVIALAAKRELAEDDVRATLQDKAQKKLRRLRKAS